MTVLRFLDGPAAAEEANQGFSSGAGKGEGSRRESAEGRRDADWVGRSLGDEVSPFSAGASEDVDYR